MWNVFLTGFLRQYVKFPESAYNSLGILNDDYIKKAFDLLVSNDVFTKEELVYKLFKDYDLFVPMNYFE